jgi:hypothetical protein
MGVSFRDGRFTLLRLFRPDARAGRSPFEGVPAMFVSM